VHGRCSLHASPGSVVFVRLVLDTAHQQSADDQVGVRLIRHARADVVAFERAVIRLPEVIHTHHITGNYDYLLHVEVADLPAYEDFHTNRLATLPSVAAVTSYVTMKTLSPVQTDA
jgi:DNA-binding Lrp family transcriptional regulator